MKCLPLYYGENYVCYNIPNNGDEGLVWDIGWNQLCASLCNFIPVLARILAELKLLSTAVGRMAMSAAGVMMMYLHGFY
ncbi:hypothetical protein AQUCO_04500165v1 [Aquilegia coerulea]|uniref:Uncharacterized protein n=1 Tax=Aquilegia coerulea TaxID=218851 RepID=A0A2G5CM28_AQUCA|nr:hypothetical protein AQUCO_04500165v1 [Aquilegia coerulea]